MSNYKRDYWRECVSSAADECGLAITAEQLEYLAESVDGANENYGMAFSSPSVPSESSQIAELKRQLATEKAKQICPTCKGRGSITSPGPYHSSTSMCYDCNGEGKR